MLLYTAYSTVSQETCEREHGLLYQDAYSI